MELLKKLPTILEESRAEYESARSVPFDAVEQIGRGDNILAVGDNLNFMRRLEEKNMKGKIQLIYIDPPFFSKLDYNSAIKLEYAGGKTVPVLRQFSYRDSWKGGIEDYLKMLCCRLYAMRELLAEDGMICVHLDWHAVHYVKVFMDAVFGEANFVNEIIWQYKSGGSSKKRFARKHDTILMYSKSKSYKFRPLQEKSYNRGYKPYRFKGVKEYRDDTGWYTMVNMKDVWQIDMVGRTSAERTGYITQKPEALISRLIEACTDEGDICADFFGGSGTLAAAAAKAGRRWIYCDMGIAAAVNAQKRMATSGAGFKVIYDRNIRGECSFDAEVREELLGEDGDRLAVVRLTGCAPCDLSRIPVSEADRARIREITEKDPLLLVDYWSVDGSYDGVVHRPQQVLVKEKKKAETECKLLVKGEGRISVRVIDIFGNSVRRTIN